MAPNTPPTTTPVASDPALEFELVVVIAVVLLGMGTVVSATGMLLLCTVVLLDAKLLVEVVVLDTRMLYVVVVILDAGTLVHEEDVELLRGGKVEVVEGTAAAARGSVGEVESVKLSLNGSTWLALRMASRNSVMEGEL